MATHGMHNTTLSKSLMVHRVAWVWSVHHQEDGESDVLDEGVEHNNGVGEVSDCHQTMVCLSSLCVHPVSAPPSHVRVHHGGVWIEVCDGACMTNDVCVVVEGDWWHLWLVAWLCHPHVCLFVIHHKWHSPHMVTLCCTTPNGWQEDLVTWHHALVGCFVTTPFLFPFQSQLSLLSQTILSSHVHFIIDALKCSLG